MRWEGRWESAGVPGNFVCSRPKSRGVRCRWEVPGMNRPISVSYQTVTAWALPATTVVEERVRR